MSACIDDNEKINVKTALAFNMGELFSIFKVFFSFFSLNILFDAIWYQGIDGLGGVLPWFHYFVKSVATVIKSTMSYTTCFYVCGWPKNLIFLVSPT